ncbi:MAG: helix-turn-helix domain-containing protein [Sediminibacterium sp.]
MYVQLIKHMVCGRCVLMVEQTLETLEIRDAEVSLGKIEMQEPIQPQLADQLQSVLASLGLEMMKGRSARLIEHIKEAVAEFLHLGIDAQGQKLSTFISRRLGYEFGHLSEQFARAEGTTVEHYFLDLRMQKVQELLKTTDQTISDIAFETGFSSVHHLAAQFKKFTGITPGRYREHIASTSDPAGIDR